MKIVSSGKVLNSSEFYEKKKRRRRVQLIFLLIGFLLILASFIFFSRQEQFLITEVSVLGEDVVDKEEITQIVRSLLTGYYLWVIPRANTFIYPRGPIKEALVEEFPRLKSVDFDLNELQALLITVEERVPFALYCASITGPADGSLPAQAGKCFFLDEGGLIFAPAPSFSGGVYFVYATRDPIENPVGKRFFTVAEFASLSKFIKTLEMINIRPSALEVRDDEYRLSVSNSGQIIWRKDAELTLIYSNLDAFLSDDAIRAQKDFFDKILYLDLRTENKVFYKFKN